MFDTFISYRRIGGASIAARVYDYLKLKGFNPFYDITGMSSGRFDQQLKSYLINSLNYVLILSKGALDRCANPEDWVYKEIVTAIEHNLNVIVLREEEFLFPENLPQKLDTLMLFQAIEFSHQNLSSKLEIMSTMLQRKKEFIETPVYDAKIRKRFKISGEYDSFYEDVEDGRIVLKRAPVILNNFLGHIYGKTWFGDTKAWTVRAKMYGKKRLVGTYFAKSNIDEGIGNFFLNVQDANTLEGFWSGYDDTHKTIATGKYIFKRRYKGYTIRKATVTDFSSVIKISDAQLGEGYLTRERLEKTLDKTLSDDIYVAVENATGNVLSFCLFKHVTHPQAVEITKGYPLRNMMFADKIGYLATVATKEGFKHLGIASALIQKSIQDMKEKGITCFLATAWKHAGIINAQSILGEAGFIKELEIPNYWNEASTKEGWSCPQCGNPCVCSCVVYTKI